MTDSYILAKSEAPQGQDLLTPFESRNWNWINDINSGVYSNTPNSLVQFDLSSLYNSGSTFIETESMFLVIPVTLSWAQLTAANAALAATNCEVMRLGLKGGYTNLINQCEIQVNGKSLSAVQSFVNVFSAFHMQCLMSEDDLGTQGPTVGLGTSVDSSLTLTYRAAASTSGLGVCNSSAFGVPINAAGATPVTQFAGLANQAFYSRLSTPISLQTNVGPVGMDSIQGATQIAAEYRPYFNTTVSGAGVICTLYDYAIIRLKDILDCFSSLPLMQRFDGFLRLYLNPSQGEVSCTTGTYGYVTGGLSSSQTCPVLINTSLPITNTAAKIVYSLSIGGAPPNTSISTFNLATGVPSHPLRSLRLYYAMTELKPSIATRYISENRHKRIRFNNYYYSAFNNITAGSDFSQLVLSGVSKPVGIVIIPYLAQSTPALAGYTQLQNPFDSAPITNGPFSLINLQVQVGGKNILENPLQYGYDEFLQQISSYQALNYSDYGVTCGLISQQEFNYGKRFYFVDLARANSVTATTPRNIVVSFRNNSLVAIDVMVFTIYSSEFDVDVSSGLITPVFSSLS